ncbi:cyclic-di-AMP receptor [Proteinivorax hydrogeniformans]|uniref:Cyclic-di-AMP receptor n=1 Tax=Proteinivorax hydrogeniformans TaxID=1826727 RepID=A0AAU8HTL9_9FIRM
MKLVVAVIQDKDSGKLLEALVEDGFKATKLASTGGFLKAGNTTVLIGVEDNKTQQVVKLIKKICKAREKTVTTMSPIGGAVESYVPYPVEIVVGGATIFVLDVDQFERV